MADLEIHPNGKHRGGDRRSATARAGQSKKTSLVTAIAERRQELDQSFFEYIRELRAQHGNSAVDRAFSLVRRERERVSAVPKRHEPFRKLG